MGKEEKEERVLMHYLNEIQDMNKDERYHEYIKHLSNSFLIGNNLLTKESSNTDMIDYLEAFRERGKTEYLDEMKEIITDLPRSNGSRNFSKINVNVGFIADEFLYNSYKDIANTYHISSEWTEAEVDNLNLDLMIVATAWKGVDESWKGLATHTHEKRQTAYDLISHLKSKGVPTVFYSKEDPVNYDLYKDLAKECDYVYTSAVECIEDYKEYCGHDRVDVLEFGVNPHYHNPVGSRSESAERLKNDIIFSGSWTQKYGIRNKESQTIFEGVLENGNDLTIIDRNLWLNKQRYQYPIKFMPNITSPISHDLLQDVHRVHTFGINVNSVKYSQSMFANRIYELQAFGNVILSNYSVGVNDKFPNVFIINTKSDVPAILNGYTDDEILSFRAKAIRNVMINNTTYHRMNQILKDTGIESSINVSPTIAVVVEHKTESVQEMFDRQICENIALLTKEEFEENKGDFDFFTYFLPEYLYEEYYLADLVSAFNYVDVDFVTKTSDNRYHHNYFEGSLDKGLTMYAVEGTNSKGYALDMSEVKKAGSMNSNYENLDAPKVSVIIPIHNNGVYLEEKCMKSLQRSTIFNQMEILFINDGSNDGITNKIINRLMRKHPNIRLKTFDTGSGSASRPRNVGAEMATGKYITYLDPDNEAIGDGYANLLQEAETDPSLDMVVGNIIKEDNKRKAYFNYYATAKKYNDDQEVISDPKAYMERCGLRAQSIQALLVKREVIQDNNIKMIEGAAGQDTLYFQELMLNSSKVKVVNEIIHMYYAAVTGSVTNTIKDKFFDKYYKLEIERIPFLQKHGLLDSYLEHRFNFYVRGWYLPRLERVEPEFRHRAVTRFLDIYSLYDEFEKPANKDLDNIIKELKDEVDYNKDKTRK
ncbi:glycosyltransferase [Salinicoccus sp. RF5]|uniref:glycosyltransferase n=1 Tax=Salinicoccus sp. RF5 TaxID=2748874 RepID=UPI001E4C4339|nr:glycosyltransferase [Salinicoccus sp. RF5]MCC4722387.1 glycosyltransferase [Salinicoccus sp. RF5]